MPPAHGFLSVEIPSHVSFQAVQLSLINFFKKASFERFAGITLCKRPVFIRQGNSVSTFASIGEIRVSKRVHGTILSLKGEW